MQLRRTISKKLGNTFFTSLLFLFVLATTLRVCTNKTLQEAIAELEDTNPCAEVQHMIDFCKATKRGITAAKRKASETDDEE